MTAMMETRGQAVLPDAVRQACRARLATAERPVRLLVCTARAGQADEATRRLVKELAALPPAVKPELLDLDDDQSLLERYGVERTPAVVLMTGGVEIGDTGIRMFARTIYGRPLAYLDSAPTAQKPEPVLRALDAYYRETNANIHRGVYTLSEEAISAGVLAASAIL